MKIFTLIIAFSLMIQTTQAADLNAPIGLQELLNGLYKISDPIQANDSTYTLKAPETKKGYHLKLEPSQAFNIKEMGDSSFLVTIVDASALFDMDLWRNYGILQFIKQKDPVTYIWSMRDVVNPITDSTAQTNCVISVSFYQTNGKEITRDILERLKQDKNWDYRLNYPSNVLELLSDEDSFSFRRHNNSKAKVGLKVYDQNNKLRFDINSGNVDYCANVGEPEVTPIWSEWSEWNKCSAECGGGTQARTRNCQNVNGVLTCEGESTQTRECNTQPCGNAKAYIKYVLKNFEATYFPPITKKYNYKVKFRNVHETATIVCDLTMYTYANNTQGSAVYKNFILSPGEETQIFEGKLQNPWGLDSKGYMVDLDCKYQE